ncbi:hypothetical protein Hanom_Chr06g00477251 [Helianthus anomalus]
MLSKALWECVWALRWGKLMDNVLLLPRCSIDLRTKFRPNFDQILQIPGKLV